MSRDLRIGLCSLPGDLFWLQAEAAIHRRARQLPIELISVYDSLVPLGREEPPIRAKELLDLELDALIGWLWPENLAYPVLESGVPIIHLAETSICHPLSLSPRGLREGARMVADYLAKQLAQQGNLLVVGGPPWTELNIDVTSRIAGVREALAGYPQINFSHIPTAWISEKSEHQIRAAMRSLKGHFDALLGLTDGLALVARDIGRSLGLIDTHTLVAGINGEPPALAAIAKADMTATAILSPEEVGSRVVDAAYQMARRLENSTRRIL